MRKVITAAVVAVIMMFSVVPAFASVDSPVATTQPETVPETTVPKKDDQTVSPKTGSSNVAACSVIALSVVGCGAAALVLTKSRKKEQ